MATCDLNKEDLVDGVDQIMGLTTFMNLVREATVNWYI
jgi:peroxiredoxin family protein